ncbi:MAG: S-methyl-5-thioribose-1-phosphate isomerase [Thaumarchaeota archaeon]|nr:S-methyl-5-thioribose-1-phosphate isomerase [Nitrososphaerota archaeon]
MRTLSDEKSARHEFPRVSVDDACANLKALRVRGGGRVARYAVHALGDYAKEAASAKTPPEYLDAILKAGEKLKSARPSAFALTNGVDYVLNRGAKRLESGGSVEEIRDAAVKASNDFLAYSMEAVTTIGEIGARRIKNGDTIITHSDSEAAMSIMKKAHDMGKGIRVYCNETRPNYQGHKTAAALAAYGIDTTLICDSACRVMMGDADKAIVGCDAISGNGALVSKIGVAQVAMLAQEARVNFIVAAETYKVDFGTLTGRLVDVEDRDPTEIATKDWMGHNPKVKFSNYVFDFTPPEYIDFYVTEKGIAPPGGIFALMQELRNEDTAWSPAAGISLTR